MTTTSNARPLHGALLMLILGSIQAVMPISIDLYLPAMPTIAQQFGVPAGTVQFTLAIFLIGVAIGQIIYGPITDKFGRKRPLAFGFVLYIIGAFLCATAPSIELLIIGRFVQALGASAGTVISSAIARDLWSGKTLAERLSLLMLVLGAAPILAPSLGGLILSWGEWHLVFWVLVIYGCAMLAALTLLPETSSANERDSVRLLDAASTYLAILRNTPFVLFVLAAACTSAMLMSYITSSSFLYIEMLGVSPRQFGIFFGTNALGLIGAAQLNRFALRRWELGTIAQRAFGATLIIVSAMAVLTYFDLIQPLSLTALFFAMCMSMGFVMPNIAALAFGHIKERMGSASALQGTIQSMVGGVAGTLIGILSNGTLWPIIGVIGCFSAIGVFLLWTTRKRVANATMSA